MWPLKVVLKTGDAWMYHCVTQTGLRVKFTTGIAGWHKHKAKIVDDAFISFYNRNDVYKLYSINILKNMR